MSLVTKMKVRRIIWQVKQIYGSAETSFKNTKGNEDSTENDEHNEEESETENNQNHIHYPDVKSIRKISRPKIVTE